MTAVTLYWEHVTVDHRPAAAFSVAMGELSQQTQSPNT